LFLLQQEEIISVRRATNEAKDLKHSPDPSAIYRK
jgi:hypothetical protein